MRIPLFLLASALLTGCVGPLVLHETARSVGDGHSELAGGYGRGGIALKWNYGLAKNLDMGIQFESLSSTAHLKYSWINNQEHGWSFASAAGAGFTYGGSAYFLDTTVSHLNDSWEPYANLRLVRVEVDPIEARDHETGDVTFSTSKFHYDYGQIMLGTRYWMSRHWLLSLEVSELMLITGGVQLGTGFLYGLAFGYRF